jgi:hypothetical protein
MFDLCLESQNTILFLKGELLCALVGGLQQR